MVGSDAGLILFAIGAWLRIWALRRLRRAGLTEDDIAFVRRPPIYVTGGPYSYVRHPCYIGALLCFAGLGMVGLGWAGFLLALPAVPFYEWRIRQEAWLRKNLKRSVDGA